MAITLGLIKQFLQVIVTLINRFMVTISQAHDEVSLLFKTHQQILRGLNLHVRVLFLLLKHSETVVETNVRNQIPGTYIILLIF